MQIYGCLKKERMKKYEDCQKADREMDRLFYGV